MSSFGFNIGCDPAGALSLMATLEKDAADLNGPMGAALEDCGEIYLEAMQMRFASAARGDGTWAPLTEATIKRKRNNSDLILIGSDGSLYTSLFPGDPNNVLRVYSAGDVIGVEAGTAHPLAAFHQRGAGHLPKRTIIVEPDALAQQHMAAAVAAGLKDVLAALRSGV